MSYNLWFLNRHLFCNYFCVLFYILFLKEDHPKYVKFTKLDSVLSLLVIIKRVVEINKPRTSKIPPNHKLNSTKIKQILRLTEIDSNTVIGYFNVPFSPINTSSREKNQLKKPHHCL